jgi:UDP-N-acetylmuramoyl-L-alanyl-D-glutamate--2,6-diaminopimelate ligase
LQKLKIGMYYIKKLFPQSIKNLYHLMQAILANIKYGFPSRKLKVIGITGTDGKTTTVQMITKILEEAGKKVAMASTINFKINGQEEKNLSHYTTESPFALQKFIKKAVKERCEYLVLETSSHALDQHRIWGVNYKTAVLTNITREHLDYHGTMEKYRKAKQKLFDVVARKKGTIIVNLDMEIPEQFLKYDEVSIFGYSQGKNTMKGNIDTQVNIINAEKVELGLNSSSFMIKDNFFKINLPGVFNIENSLAAICVGLSEGISLKNISDALEKIEGVSGRMEFIKNNKELSIIVDFALTPAALEKLYFFISQTKKEESKLIAIFGSCGERDRGKRPVMGEVVSKYADSIIVTNDEPYHEDPKRIIDEIVSGINNKKENENLWIIPDRREAIKKSLQMTKAGDIIVITGMGNFESMVVGDDKIPWSDKGVIEEELKRI